MKKILSLLSLLTMTGTTMPSVVSANSYQEEEKLNNEFNYKQIINYKKIYRIKRQDNYCTIENYCPETGNYRFNIANYFPVRNITIVRRLTINNGIVGPDPNYIPPARDILVGLMRANANERGVNIDRNYLNVVSITSNSAIIESIRSPENIIFYGNFTVNF